MKRLATRTEMLYRVSMPYDTNIWYHVTDASNLQSIRDHGLAPYNRGITEKAVPDFSIVENGIYLSPSVSGAQAFANAYKSRDRGQYAILQIRDIDKNRLIIDPEDVVAEWDQFSYYTQKIGMSLDDTRAEIIGMGYPQSIVDNAQALIKDRNISDAFWAETLLKMTLEERNRMNQVWKEHRPTSAFVYLGVIPAQNISFVSFNNEDPPIEIGDEYYDDYQDEFAENYQFQPMFSKMAAETATQLMNRAAQLPEDTSEIIYTFADGWTIRQPRTWNDIAREGSLMSNCLLPPLEDWAGVDRSKWFSSEYIHEIWDEYRGEKPNSGVPYSTVFSLRDPNNIPHATLTEDNWNNANLLGRHNSEIKPEYYYRFLDAGFDSEDIFTDTELDDDPQRTVPHYPNDSQTSIF